MFTYSTNVYVCVCVCVRACTRVCVRVCVLQHIVFGVCRLIDIMVPDVPESLELKIKRERYLAKQALADAEALQV